jgi:hypothetical protein
MNDVTRELGGALGVAVLGSLVASRYDSIISGVISSLPRPGPRRRRRQPVARSRSALASVGPTAGASSTPPGARTPAA